jgi:hypothetical protein
VGIEPFDDESSETLSVEGLFVDPLFEGIAFGLFSFVRILLSLGADGPLIEGDEVEEGECTDV